MPRTRRQHKCLRDTYWRAHTSLYSQEFLEATGPTDTYTNTHILLSSEGTGGRCSGGGEGESERDSLCPVRDTPGRTTGTHLSCSRGFQRTHMHHPLLSHGSSVHLATVRGKAQPLGCGSLNHLPSAGDRSGWGSEVFLTATHGSHIREETQHRVADLMGHWCLVLVAHHFFNFRNWLCMNLRLIPSRVTCSKPPSPVFMSCTGNSPPSSGPGLMLCCRAAARSMLSFTQ